MDRDQAGMQLMGLSSEGRGGLRNQDRTSLAEVLPELLRHPPMGAPWPAMDGKLLSWDDAVLHDAVLQGGSGSDWDSLFTTSSTTATRANSSPLEDISASKVQQAEPASSQGPLCHATHFRADSQTYPHGLNDKSCAPASDLPGVVLGHSPFHTGSSTLASTSHTSPMNPATPNLPATLPPSPTSAVLQAFSQYAATSHHHHSRSMPALHLESNFNPLTPPHTLDRSTSALQQLALPAYSPSDVPKTSHSPDSHRIDPLECLRIAPELVRSNSRLEMLHALLDSHEDMLFTPRMSPTRHHAVTDESLADLLLGPLDTADYAAQSSFATQMPLSPELFRLEDNGAAPLSLSEDLKPPAAFALHGAASCPAQYGRTTNSSASSTEQTPALIWTSGPLLGTSSVQQPSDQAPVPMVPNDSLIDVPLSSAAPLPPNIRKKKAGRPKGSTARSSDRAAAQQPGGAELELNNPIKDEPFTDVSDEGVRQSHRRHTPPKWTLETSASEDLCIQAIHGKRRAPLSTAALEAQRNKPGRKRLAVDHINLELLQENGYFDMPIQEAAQQLKVGLSVLKRICRQMGLARWPYRTRQSLRGVIAKTQQYYRGEEAGDGVQKAEVVQALQSTLDSLKGVPGQGLSDSVRKYRQSVFKLNYKIKKQRAAPENDTEANSTPNPAIPSTAAARVAVSEGPSAQSDSEWWLRAECDMCPGQLGPAPLSHLANLGIPMLQPQDGTVTQEQAVEVAAAPMYLPVKLENN